MLIYQSSNKSMLILPSDDIIKKKNAENIQYDNTIIAVRTCSQILLFIISFDFFMHEIS